MRKRCWVRDAGKAYPARVANPATARSPKGTRGSGGRGRPDMERALHATEETALNPDPFDLVAPDFVTPALVGLGTLRQGSDAVPAVPMSVPVRPAAERKRGSSL